MKKGGIILLCVFAASVCLLLGVFIGRNHRGDYAKLPQNNDSIAVAQTAEAFDYRLDLNEATEIQLMDLPGIGEVLAERIITYRNEFGPFSSIDDLMKVEGIGDKKLKAIEQWIKVGG